MVLKQDRERDTFLTPGIRLLRLFLISLCITSAVQPPAAAGNGEVTLPLAQYLEMVEAAEARNSQGESAEEPASISWLDHQIKIRLHTVERESTAVDVNMTLNARAIGRPDQGLPLEFAGFISTLETVADSDRRDSTVRPNSPRSAWQTRSGRPPHFLVTSPGTYQIKVAGQLLLNPTDSGHRIHLPRPMASVSTLEIELPAELQWQVSDGPILVGERELDGKRLLTFAVARGSNAWIDLAESSVTSGSDRLLASSVVATVVQLQRQNWQRHDVAMFDVSRGSLDTMRLTLPNHLKVDRAVTDEEPLGWLDPASADLELIRRSPLKAGGTGGYVALVSPLLSADVESAGAGGVNDSRTAGLKTIDLATVVPEPEIRAHYLAVTGPVPAEVQPVPAESWARVDADDLPGALSEALGVADLVAVWRRVDGRPAGSLNVLPMPDAPRIESWVSERSTTTLLTVDGTLLHRDLLEVAPVGTVLEVQLPEHAVLWSVKVGSESIRPLERDGKLLIPMSLASADGASVELVTVLERVVPAGRSVLDLELPQIGLPVVEHTWRLLLPKEDRYRYRGGSLSYTSESVAGSLWTGLAESDSTSLIGRLTDIDEEVLPGVTITIESPQLGQRMAVTDASGRYRFDNLIPGRVAVTASLEGFDNTTGIARLRRRKAARLDLVMPVSAMAETIVVTSEATSIRPNDLRKEAKMATEAQVLADYQANVVGLQQGLVGGVRPLPVTIPEEGKSLSLVGVLPPTRVTASLDVKAGR